MTGFKSIEGKTLHSCYFSILTFRKDILSEDEIKEGIDNQIDVLHPPGVPLGAAPVLGGGGQTLVDDLMVQHPLHPSGAGLLLLHGVILSLEMSHKS